MSNGMKSVFKSKNGNVADINLLLTAMLKHEQIFSYPVILSTREHGFIHEIYPLINRFNYVVSMLRIDSTTYILDASERKLGFNKLPQACYNGYARVIAPEPVLIDLSADSLKERKVTSVFIRNDEKGESVGAYNSELGYFESMSTREKISKKGKEEFEKGIKTAYPAEIKVGQVKIDSLNSYDDPIQIHYDLNLKDLETEDIIYFTPLLSEAYKDNYFKAAERFYPVEMPYSFDETYILNMQIPQGYVVDELPKSARVAMNENEGYFEYLIDQRDGMVRLKSRVQLRKANFLPEDYEGLRSFFDYVVKKHAEQIVFKKKK